MKTILFKLSLVLAMTFVCFSCDEDNSDTETLSLEYHNLTLSVGETTTLSIIESPNTSDAIVWSSSDESVATVFYGKVEALSSGVSTITVQMGDYFDTCQITVPEQEYQLVWADEFDSTALNTDYWNIEVNGYGGGNNEEQYYTARDTNLRVENGMLVIQTLKESYMGDEYTSARINTKGKKQFTYGKVEVRLKVPAGKGLWGAFWMLGANDGWPDGGEIDIMEYVGYEPYEFHCALHTANYNGMNGNNKSGSQTLTDSVSNDFHVITMEWVKNALNGYDRIYIYVDDVLTRSFSETAQLQDSGDWPFNDEFYFIINMAIGGNWGGVQGIDDTIFDEPVLYLIDYVRVYQLQ